MKKALLFFLITFLLTKSLLFGNPDSADAYFNEANKYYVNSKFDKAIEYYTKAIEANPEFAEAYYNRGKSYQYIDNHEKAIADFDKAIELKSNYINAYYNRGVTYINLGQYEKAIPDFNKSIELDSKWYYAYTYLSACLIYTENYKEAFNVLNKAITLEPKNSEAYIYKGLYYYFLKDYKNALKSFEEAIALNSYYPYTYFLHLISSYKISDSDFTKSLVTLNKVKKNFINSKLEYMIAEYVDNKLNSEKLIKEALNDNIKLCTVYCAIGYKYLFDNNIAKAKEFFQKSIETKAFEFYGYKLVEKELSWLEE